MYLTIINDRPNRCTVRRPANVVYQRILQASMCIVASALLVSCTKSETRAMRSSLHRSDISLFTSAEQITNAFSGVSVSIGRVGAGTTNEFLIVTEQFRSTKLLDTAVYERFADKIWYLRGIVSSYSRGGFLVNAVFTNRVLSIYRDQQLQMQFMSTEMSEQFGGR